MRWFKHYSSARGDERLSSLEDKTGLEGYGFYFKVLEVVAEVMNETDNCSVTYSITRWGRQLNITTKKFLYLSQCCSELGLMNVCRASDSITIETPNLLKYRDNHTKNLQATCKQEKEIEKEVDKEEEKPKPPSKKAAVSIQTFLDNCKREGVERIPKDDSVFDFADNNKIPIDMVRVCWQQFVRTHRENGKRQADWRKTFRNCVRGNWYKLWFIEADGMVKETSQFRALKKDLGDSHAE
jgi:hypothetical protein